jgi:hypothetical protein
MVIIILKPSNGYLKVINLYKITATDQISIFESYFRSNNSGAVKFIFLIVNRL